MDASEKRVRDTNWSEDEKKTLIAAVEQHLTIINDKRNDTETLEEKEKVWHYIFEFMKQMGYCRDKKRIKQQWNRMKTRGKCKPRVATTSNAKIAYDESDSSNDDKSWMDSHHEVVNEASAEQVDDSTCSDGQETAISFRKAKRDREVNWSVGEKKAFKEAVSKYISIVDSKANDKKTILLKAKAWYLIKQRMEYMGYYRDVKKIKQQWNRTKARSKTNRHESANSEESFPQNSDLTCNEQEVFEELVQLDDESLWEKHAKKTVNRNLLLELRSLPKHNLDLRVLEENPIAIKTDFSEDHPEIGSNEPVPEVEIASPQNDANCKSKKLASHSTDRNALHRSPDHTSKGVCRNETLPTREKRKQEMADEIHQLQVQRLKDEIAQQKERHNLEVAQLRELHELKRQLLQQQILKAKDALQEFNSFC